MQTTLADDTTNLEPTAPVEDELSAWTAVVEAHLRRTVASGNATLPAYPAVAIRVQELLALRADMNEVARAVGADSALAANVLRCANSALHRRAIAPTTLVQAITHIGGQEVLRLALASGLAARALETGPMVTLRRRYWLEGLACAVLAAELAPRRQIPPDQAFLLGLLHDFGRIVALQSIETSCRGDAHPLLPQEALERLTEEHHVALGLALARRWKFPDALQEVIASHHSTRTSERNALAELISTSDAVVQLLASQPALRAADLACIPGLQGLEERERVERVVNEIPELAASFEPELSPRPGKSALIPSRLREVRPLGARFRVKVTVGGRGHEYQAVAMDAGGLVLEGSHALAEHRLAKMELQVPRAAFDCWSLCAASETGSNGLVRMELRPYALRGASQARWVELASDGGPEK